MAARSIELWYISAIHYFLILFLFFDIPSRKQRRKKTKEASGKAQGGHGTSLKLMNEAEEEHDEVRQIILHLLPKMVKTVSQRQSVNGILTHYK